MYAGNAGAFTGSPCGSSCGRSNVLSIGHPGLAKNSGVSHPGKRVQQVNVPLAHLQFLFHPDKFVELGSHPGLEKTIMHKKRDLKAPIILRNDLWVGDYFGHPALRPSGRPSDVQNRS